jgi:hypothetical protein
MATTMIPSRAKCSHHKRSIRAPPRHWMHRRHEDAEQIGHQFPADCLLQGKYPEPVDRQTAPDVGNYSASTKVCDC